ncbi:MAG: 1,4-beta cellobiohydrolase [Candidatus Saccharibacteria bacterium]|nr:1,4-beta cellobiohydrolase [Candidatus Saccharibacteria bacterium]
MRFRTKIAILALTLVASLGIPLAILTRAEAEPSTNYAVFTDQFQNDWTNWSWSGQLGVQDNQIAFTPSTGWFGLYLHTDRAVPTSPYNSIQFKLKTSSPTSMRLYGFDQNWQPSQSVELKDYVTANISNDGWRIYTVPLSALRLASNSLNGLVLQDTTGQTQPTFYMDDVALQANAITPAPSTQPQNSFDFSANDLPNWAGAGYEDSDARGGTALLVWTNATVSNQYAAPASNQIIIRAKADLCQGAATMVVSLDGKALTTIAVDSAAWRNYSIPVAITAGDHTVSVAFTNDAHDICDRNLRLDTLTFGVGTPETAVAAPTAAASVAAKSSAAAAGAEANAVANSVNNLVSASLYVDPNTAAAQQVAAWKNSRPQDANLLAKIANQPTAKWFGDWSGDVSAAVRSYVNAAGSKVPILVAYNIPNRDCGSYSAGGSANSAAYSQWVSAFASGLGGHKAIVILEPDALALNDCLSALDKQSRYQMLSEAVTTLSAQGALVYLDAGNSTWVGVDDMGGRLQQAGIAKASGFALNVSNFNSTSSEVAYGNKLNAMVHKPFVVDTSRNGNGTNGQFCNPSGRAIGQAPTLSTGQANVDAFLWIKIPGESDGTCNGGPSAGAWWADYALGLVRN